MKRLSGRLRLVFVTLAIIGGLGIVLSLSVSSARSHAPTKGAVSGEWSVGDSVTLASGVDVTLVSADNIPPKFWLEHSIEAVARNDRLWLAFEVVNSSADTVSVPGRPWGARVHTRDRLRSESTSAFVDGPGGGFGPGANPYLEPGDSMHVLFEYEVIDPARPIEISYAPLSEESITYVLE